MSKLPNANKFSCSTCHVTPGGPRNPFGLAVEDRVTPNGQEDFWDETLAALDSDEDGIPNGVELLDPDGLWRPGDANPGDIAFATNPGEADAPPAVEFVRGDFDGDGAINISDPIGTLNHLFSGADGPPCGKAADVNGDGALNISDATYTLNFLFSGGPEPAIPYPDCDTEVDETALSCEISPCV